MDKKSTYMIVGIVVVGVVVFMIISFQKSTLDTEAPEAQNATTSDWINAPAEKAIMVTPKTVVTAKHSYRTALHIVAGEVPLPTPCDILTAQVVVSADKKQVLIQLVSTVKTGEMCAQVITPARFKVSAKADKSATIAATLNGQPVTLNLIEAGPNENLDDFELYIKG